MMYNIYDNGIIFGRFNVANISVNRRKIFNC